MVFNVIKFRFTTPLHLSKARADYVDSDAYWHSDGWYAAIMQAWALLGMTEHLDALQADGTGLDFTLSSLFPYTTDEAQRTVFFLPRPLGTREPLLAESLKQERDERRKALKKLAWMDVDRLAHCLQEPSAPWVEHWSELKGAYLTARTLPKQVDDGQLLHRDLTPKVAIDPQTGESTPYYLERLSFEAGSGWYGLFRGTEAAWKAVQTAVLLLGEEGIGTDRHVGNGKYEVCLATAEETQRFQRLLQTEQDTDYYYNLSLYNPTDASTLQQALTADQAERISYALVKRGGWITTPPYHSLRRRPLHFFKEGSILHFPNGNPNETGAICDVRPKAHPNHPELQTEHPIWRVGKSFFIPFKYD